MRAFRSIGLLLLLFWAGAASAGSIEDLPNMKCARAGAQATTLPNGKILITGGNTFVSSTCKDADIFDPALKTFTGVANFLNGYRRTRHTATLLDDGTVLIVGGTSNYGEYAQIYNPGSQSFSLTSGPLTGPARQYHTAIKLTDGRVLIVGGVYDRFAEIYNPNTQTFAALDPTVKGPWFWHRGHTATLLCDGTVLIAGDGACPNSSTCPRSNVTELFDPSTNSFISLAQSPPNPSAPAHMNHKRGLHTATMLCTCPCSEVLLDGGNDSAFDPAISEIYNATTRTFSDVAGTPLCGPARTDGVVVRLASGELLLTGGYSSCLPSIATFNASTKTFTGEALTYSGPGGSVFYNPAPAVALYDSSGDCSGCPAGKKVLLAGGGDFTSSVPGASVYVPTNMSAPPPTIASISPAVARTCGGTQVTITGANFQNGATASLYNSLSVISATATQIVGTTAATSPQTAYVSVYNPDHQYATLVDGFEYKFFPPGDANGDSILSQADLTRLANFLFKNGLGPVN